MATLFDQAPSRRAIRPLVAPLILLLLLGACARQSALTMAEKTALTRELVADRVECVAHGRVLATPAKDELALRALYEAAKAAHCLKPDV